MRRRHAVALAVAVAVLGALPIATPPPVARAATVCTGWSNMLVPPSTIRVLRTATNQVQQVDFKQYVKIVMAAEWPSSWPTESLRAGAVTIKEYAWYFAMNYRGGTGTGGCYDVADSTRDQVYQPESRTPAASHNAAVDATWPESITKGGSLFVTGYRSGASVACGTDADGSHLFQYSARDCALKGMTADQILAVYYYPGLAIYRPPERPTGTFFGAPARTQTSARSSVKATWSEEPDPGTTIASRSLRLLMAKPFAGSCAVERWLPAQPAFSSTAPPPATVSGLTPGVCYRFVLELKDSVGKVNAVASGAVLVDPAAPLATFTSPVATGLTKTAGGAITVGWTEAPAAGATIVSRSLTEEYSPAPSADSCTGAAWRTAWKRSVAPGYAVTGMARLFCYRFAVTLTDSAGRTGTWMSGDVLTPASF